MYLNVLYLIIAWLMFLNVEFMNKKAWSCFMDTINSVVQHLCTSLGRTSGKHPD